MRVVVKNLMYGKVANAVATHTFEGDEVPTPKWVEYPALALATGDRTFPIRIISRDTIIKIDNVNVERKFTAEPTKKTYTVQGSKGSTYLVTVNGKYKSCTCSGFQFRRNCKHVAEIE
jgi:SWIM zinc finger